MNDVQMYLDSLPSLSKTVSLPPDIEVLSLHDMPERLSIFEEVKPVDLSIYVRHCTLTRTVYAYPPSTLEELTSLINELPGFVQFRAERNLNKFDAKVWVETTGYYDVNTDTEYMLPGGIPGMLKYAHYQRPLSMLSNNKKV